MQPREQKIPRPIAREHPPGPIRPMRRRRQPDDPDPCKRIPKPRHGLAPILPLRKRPPLLFGDPEAVGAQTIAAIAANYFARQLFQSSHSATLSYAIRSIRGVFGYV